MLLHADRTDIYDGRRRIFYIVIDPKIAHPKFPRRQRIRLHGFSVSRDSTRFMRKLRVHRIEDDRTLPGRECAQVVLRNRRILDTISQGQLALFAAGAPPLVSISASRPLNQARDLRRPPKPCAAAGLPGSD